MQNIIFGARKLIHEFFEPTWSLKIQAALPALGEIKVLHSSRKKNISEKVENCD